MRCSRTEAPSLHRRYPASPVLQASPPPSPAQPDPRGLSVGACHATGRASRVASIPLFHACCRQYPGGSGRCSRRSLPDRWQPSPCGRRVGFRITGFGPARRSVALRPAWSLNRPRRPLSSECFGRYRCLHRPLRLLPAGATVAGRDSHPLRNGAVTAHCHGLSARGVRRTTWGPGPSPGDDADKARQPFISSMRIRLPGRHGLRSLERAGIFGARAEVGSADALGSWRLGQPRWCGVT